MSWKKKIHFVLTTHVPKNFVWKWFGSVHEYYVLKSSSVKKLFEQFDTTNILDFIKNRDESEDVALWKLFNFEEDATDAMSQWRKATVKFRALHIDFFPSDSD